MKFCMQTYSWGASAPLLLAIVTITYSVLISPCFALDPYEKQQLIKPELAIVV